MSKVQEKLATEILNPARTYTKEEVAHFLHTSWSVVDDLESYGLIRGIKMPRTTIFSLAEILRFQHENIGEDLSSKSSILKMLERRMNNE